MTSIRCVIVAASLLIITLASEFAPDFCDSETCTSSNHNETVHAILRENLFLKEMLRKAATAPPQVPWWQQRREDNPDSKGILGLYYATPMFRTNLNLLKSRAEVHAINKELEEAILSKYFATVDEGVGKHNLLHQTERDHMSVNEINNEFFHNQNEDNKARRSSYNSAKNQKPRAPLDPEPADGSAAVVDVADEEEHEMEGFLDHLPAMQKLKGFWKQSLRRYWDNVPGNVGSMDEFERKSGSDFFYWAAVNHHNIEHRAHVHYRSYLSGVYYVKTPPLSGLFHFYDQRGYPMYPFNSDRSFAPTAGDLILFPGFVPHSVDATPGADPRVAIAFNLNGNPDLWRRMVDVYTLQDIEE